MSKTGYGPALELLAGVEPEDLAALARRHGLAPLLFSLLKKAEPTPAIEGLMESSRNALRQSMVFDLLAARDACALSADLQGAGIDVLVLKGPTLTRLYGPGQREYSDLDLLVRPSDLLLARRLLIDQGYRQISGPPEHLLDRHLAVGKEIGLAAPGRIPIDLHWRFGERAYPFELPDNNLWSRSQTIDLKAGQVQTLGNEELLLYLCFHGTKHYWLRLLWLSDVARLLQSTSFDWPAVVRLSKQTGSERCLSLALFLVRDLLACELPGLPRSAGSRLDGALAAEVVRFLAVPPNTLRRTRFRLRARERRRDKARFLLGRALRLGEYGWETLTTGGG